MHWIQFIDYFVMISFLNIILVLFTSFFSIFILFGWGRIISKVFYITKPSLSSTLIVGFVFTSFLIELLNFILPINWIVSLAISFVGLLGGGHSINKRGQIKSFFKSHQKVALVLLAILVYWALRVIKVSTNYDTAAYHLQIIRWFNEYPIIPGIGNIHTHLAYNQSYFGFLSLLQFFPYFQKGFEIGALIMFMIMLFFLIERSKKLSGWFASIAFFLYLVSHSAGSTLFSPTPDLTFGFVEILIFTLMIDFLLEKNQKIKYEEYLPVFVLISCYLFTLKLTGAFFSMTSILVLFYLGGRTYFNNKNFLKILCFSSFMIFIHLIRGYVLSGSPFFPNSLFIADFLPWVVPRDVALKDAFEIYAVARNPNLPSYLVMGNWDWLSTWIQNRFSLANKIYVVLAAILIIVNSYLFFIKRSVDIKYYKLIGIFIPIFVSLVFWFFTAPDFRYLGAALELLIALLTFILFLFFLSTCNLSVKYKNINPIHLCFIAIFITILPNLTLKLFGPWEDLPNTQVSQKSNTFGVVYNKPINGLCWYAPIPCVDSLDDDIRYLDNKNIKGGVSAR